MLNIIKKSLKISTLGTIVAILFFSLAGQSHAQYYYGYNTINPLTSITTTNVTNITDVSAVINGLVNGTKLYNTYNINTWFEYGTNPNFGYSTSHSNSNTGYNEMTATIANLTPNTIYYFRAVGQNGQGAVLYGSTNSFRTNYGNTNATNTGAVVNSSYPAVLNAITLPATATGTHSVNLNAIVTSPNSNSSTTWFEYGKTPDLGNITPTISTGGLPAIKHLNTLTGLASGTVYYFRAVVENGTDRIVGSTLSFTTNSSTQSDSSNNTISPIITSTDTITPATNQDLGSYLGANVFASGSFLPGNVFGWLILLILILILIMVVRHPNVGLVKSKQTDTNHH
jgi:hypothetical protein